MQISLLSSFRNLFSWLSVFPGIPAVTLHPQSLCAADGAHHLLTRRLLSMCNQWVSGDGHMTQGVKRVPPRRTSLQCKMKCYINAE